MKRGRGARAFILLYEKSERGGGRGWGQGRIQDLSEGGARFISEQKHPDLGTKFFKDRYFSCFALGYLSLNCY